MFDRAIAFRVIRARTFAPVQSQPSQTVHISELLFHKVFFFQLIVTHRPTRCELKTKKGDYDTQIHKMPSAPMTM